MVTNFDSFRGAFLLDAQASTEDPDIRSFGLGEPLTTLLQEFSGASFNGGLYRIHSAVEIKKWNTIVGRAFPDFANRLTCFAFDWLGRQFALDSARVEDGKQLVLLMEPGTGEALEVPTNLVSFHNSELVDVPEAPLCKSFYNNWLESGGRPLRPSECVGYKVPLYLGGADNVQNLEIVDLEVYWELCAQLLDQVKSLPPGTRIGQVKIS